MSAIITTKFRYQTAVNLINAMGGNGSQADDSYYMFIGRTEPWADDENPPSPEDSISEENAARNAMLSLKLITAAKISHVIPRYNWVSGQSYSEYDDQDELLTTKQFYVYTQDDLSVYKCIKAGSGASIVRPSVVSSGMGAVLSDGYQWKYMFTLSGGAIGTFTTSTFIPVKTLATDDTSYQWDVQQAAIPGAIYRIKITDGGAGYASKPTVTIVGNGTSCTIQAGDITMSGGAVSEILVNSARVGSGYTQAKVVFSGGGPTRVATARAVISPPGGHGSDAVQELGGYYAMITATLSGEEQTGDFIIDNGFRQIGILRNPIDNDTDEIGTATTYNALTALTYSNVNGVAFQANQTITGGTSGAKAYIDSVTETQLFVHQTTTTGFASFSASELLNNGSGTTATLGSITIPEADKYTGELLYIENISPVTRNINQTEDIKLVLEL
jgi:hypothetical protein